MSLDDFLVSVSFWLMFVWLLASAISRTPWGRAPSRVGQIGLRVDGFFARRRPMAEVDRGSITVTDAEKVPLSIGAKDLGGVKLPASEFEWSSSDEAVVMLEPMPDTDDGAGNITPGDPYGRMARTPAPGTAVVRVLHVPSGNSEIMTIIVAFSAAGEIGLSAGTAIPE